MGEWEDEMCEDKYDEDHPPPGMPIDGTERRVFGDGSYEVYRHGRGWVSLDEEESEDAMREIEWLVIHCSDSDYGDYDVIGFWHKATGWGDEYDSVLIHCGYHFVILDGHISDQSENDVLFLDGSVEVGRKLAQEGAHVKHANENSVGICLIGRSNFSNNQLEACRNVCRALMEEFGVDAEHVVGHREVGKINAAAGAEVARQNKSCPNMDMDQFRASLGQQEAPKRSWWVKLLEFLGTLFKTK